MGIWLATSARLTVGHHQPKQEEVAGSYLLAQQTITTNGLAVLQGRRCHLDLQPDGSFQVTNYPTWTNDQFEGIISTTGRWTRDTVGGVNGKSIWGIRFIDADRKIDTLVLTGKATPYGLMMIYSDPDEGEVMFSRRRSDDMFWPAMRYSEPGHRVQVASERPRGPGR